MRLIGKSTRERDFSHGHSLRILRHHRARAAETDAQQVLMGCRACRLSKCTGEVINAQVCDACEIGNRNALGKVAFQTLDRLPNSLRYVGRAHPCREFTIAYSTQHAHHQCASQRFEVNRTVKAIAL